MQPEHVIARLEKDALPWLAASWDHSGIQVRGNRDRITRMAVALDPTIETIRTASDQGADFILTHHPLGLTPRFPAADDELHATMSLLMQQGIWLYAAHTTLDAQPEGPANWLARDLGLINRTVLEPTASSSALLVRIPHGRNLCPIELPGVVTVMEQETILELVVWKNQWSAVRRELEHRRGGTFDYHALPLEEPSRSFGFGCMGDLEVPMDWSSFQTRLAGLLGTAYWTRIGTPPAAISRVAYCPGSGASAAHRAFALGAHVYITGDIKYHQAQEIQSLGLALDVGHYILEEKMMHAWFEMLKPDFTAQGVELVFIPGKNPLCVEKT
jgi:dinuclear metal center YbgI/SA1388 family protein